MSELAYVQIDQSLSYPEECPGAFPCNHTTFCSYAQPPLFIKRSWHTRHETIQLLPLIISRGNATVQIAAIGIFPPLKDFSHSCHSLRTSPYILVRFSLARTACSILSILCGSALSPYLQRQQLDKSSCQVWKPCW